MWELAKRRGFEVVVYDRNVRNQEKKIDTTITRDITLDIVTRMAAGDTVTLVAGDSDYVPLVDLAKQRKIAFEVFFWSNCSRELREQCTKFVELDQYLGFLTFARS